MTKPRIRRKYVRGFGLSGTTDRMAKSSEDLFIRMLSADGNRFEEIVFDMSDYDMIRLFKRLRATVSTRLRAQVESIREKASAAGFDPKDVGL